MLSIEYFREFVNERLTTTAEEIFGVFNKAVIEYEEEIDRLRRLLDIILKPEIQLHRIELPQNHVCKEEEEVLPDQPLFSQEGNSSLDQEEPEPPQIKDEQEELCISQEGEQLVMKQETDNFMVTPPYEENEPVNHREPYCCHTCGKRFWRESELNIHLRMHTIEKPYTCKTCGKSFSKNGTLLVHKRIHTGEKPYLCKICGRPFRCSSTLSVHMRIHTGEKPHSCQTCGKKFRYGSNLKVHMRIHSGEKPYCCKICGRCYSSSSNLSVHIKIHADEQPYKFPLRRDHKIPA